MADQKSFSLKIPYESWLFVKKLAADKDITMNSLISELIKKAKDKYDKKNVD